VVGPPPMIPVGIEALGVTVLHDMARAIRDVDVIMMLRVQFERQGGFLMPSVREYSNLYCLTGNHLKNARDDVLILHPGPVNRGIEIALDVMDGPRSMILQQVNHGVAVRMAIMYLLMGGGDEGIN
jgi:aspartate carbamoyltransferase catalytic subunit